MHVFHHVHRFSSFYISAGNRNIHAITKSGKYELRVELEDFQKHEKIAHYSSFSVGDAASNYKLTVDGYNGTAGQLK